MSCREQDDLLIKKHYHLLNLAVFRLVYDEQDVSDPREMIQCQFLAHL
jgi:hypothetical protein